MGRRRGSSGRGRWETPARAPAGLRPARARLPPQVRNSNPSCECRRRGAVRDVVRGEDRPFILIRRILYWPGLQVKRDLVHGGVRRSSAPPTPSALLWTASPPAAVAAARGPGRRAARPQHRRGLGRLPGWCLHTGSGETRWFDALRGRGRHSIPHAPQLPGPPPGALRISETRWVTTIWGGHQGPAGAGWAPRRSRPLRGRIRRRRGGHPQGSRRRRRGRASWRLR